ncbi:hypothetical protein [Burkholderia territorii]|uniref:hypothetical protein n=1 Tax=Burkholderia territorii TaxID=1503055 RepID=UPI001E4A261C|nr:hypothetical protein [Burkholderia territorii]
MKRPSFQFYPGDWTSNSNLRRCSHAEKGIWIDVMCLLHDQEEYGIVRWPLKEIAQAVNCTVAALRGLVNKGILKGADAPNSVEPFIYTPRSGRKDGEPVTLVCSQVGPLWYSSRMVKDEYVRTVRGESSRFGATEGDAPKDAPKHAPKPPFGDGSSASSSSSASQTTSVPTGTDAGASPPGLSAKDAIFHIALPWLVERGVPDKSARSLLGGAIKQLGDDAAWALAQDCMREAPLAPAGWVAAAINARMPAAKGKGKPSRHGGFDQIDYREGVAADGSF